MSKARNISVVERPRRPHPEALNTLGQAMWSVGRETSKSPSRRMRPSTYMGDRGWGSYKGEGIAISWRGEDDVSHNTCRNVRGRGAVGVNTERLTPLKLTTWKADVTPPNSACRTTTESKPRVTSWRKIEQAKGMRPRFNMVDHYAHARDLMHVTWRYSFVQ